MLHCLISIHAPLRGRHTLPVACVIYPNFNPRPLAGATQLHVLAFKHGPISIHAPLRGRRPAPPCHRQRSLISIHAPLRGRLVGASLISGSGYFNPRPLAGATAIFFFCSGSIKFQSTPPCGGDPVASCWLQCCYHFNPRPLAGATLTTAVADGGVLFQSTHPCGGDGRHGCSATAIFNFNPRPLAGATCVRRDILPGNAISIHAPLRGRHVKAHAAKYNGEFQSTPPCGGDEPR